MKLFDHSGDELAKGPSLLFAIDSRQEVLATAGLYDPAVREWRGRLVFSNGVLLFGPTRTTPALTAKAGIPADTTVGWYARTALQRHSRRRSHEARAFDAERLVRGLALRLGGRTHPEILQPNLALLASVYGTTSLSAAAVIEVLRPFNGDLRVEDEDSDDSYAITGDAIWFYTAYRSPRQFTAKEAPAALGDELRKERLHHWDLHAGVPASDADPDLCVRVGSAALALADRANGVAIDMLGFRMARAQDLRPG
jgi:hypothetical protein